MKKIIRLTENDLHRIVKESVQRILRESRLSSPRFDLTKYPADVRINYTKNNKIFKEIKKNGFYIMRNAKVIIQTSDGKRSVVDNQEAGDMGAYELDSFIRFMKVVHPEYTVKQTLIPYNTEDAGMSVDTYCHVKLVLVNSGNIGFSPNDVPNIDKNI